jgi:membrane-associated phospholipid phosphatase
MARDDSYKSMKNNRVISFLDSLDKYLSNKIHSLEFSKEKEFIIYFFGRIFNPDYIFFYHFLILIYKSYFENDFIFVFKPLLHTLISVIITLILKKLTARPRPLENLKVVRFSNLRKHENNCSMPSGDSLQSANFSIILLFYFNCNLGFYLIPFVMFSRIYFFCHYILDTVVGSLMGLIISYNIYLLIN